MGNFVVAGGTKGIGRELVSRLAMEATKVDVYSREIDDLTQRENVEHHSCDFLKDDLELDGLPESIHGAVYCPGSINLRSFRGLKLDDFRADLELNVIGAVKFLKECLPGLKNGAGKSPPSVIFFSTVAVAQGMPMHASVATAKGAIEGLTKTLAAELSPTIRVNCIAPALTDTPLTARFYKSEEARQKLDAKYPLERSGTPSDIAATAMFLLSQDAGWITGQIIGVDGGLSSLRK